MKKITLLFLLLLGVCINSFGQASLCEEAESITLPYSDTDFTGNYGNNYVGAPGSSCGGSLSFLYGNDVVYAYTAPTDGSINISLSTTYDFVGLFIYDDCADIGQSCITGVTNQEITDDTMSIDSFPVNEGTTYYFVISNAAPVEAVSYSLNIAQETCENPTVAYTVVSDCAANPQFLMEVTVEDMGSATSLTITDGYDGEQVATAPGTFTFGPYNNGAWVQYTVSNDQDSNCEVTSAPYTQNFCAPLNNFCSGAIDLATQISPLDGTTVNSTHQNTPSCASFNTQAGDVYYSIDVPNGSTLSISQIDSNYESVISIFLGDCDDALFIACIDYGDRSYTYFNDSGEDRKFYWIQDGYNGETGNFTLEWSLTDCVMPEVQYTIQPYCDEGAQFLVNAEVYSLGSASSLTITDNAGSDPQIVTEAGTLQFGPYDNFTEVVFTASNDDDSACFTTSPTMVQYYCPPCTNAQANFNIELECGEVQGYYVNVDVWDMGSSDSVTISDDQGNSMENITATGVYQFGPYPPMAPLVFTISDNDDVNCIATHNVQSYTACPPANDNCSNAIVLTVGENLASSGISVTNSGATTSPELPTPTCGELLFTVFGKDIWYTVEVPASGNLTIETTGQLTPEIGILTDSVLQVYSGDCSGFTAVDCSNDGGTGNFSIVSLTDRTPGEILYVRVFGYYGSAGSFTIGAYDDSPTTIPCTNPTVTYDFELDCGTNAEYYVDISVTDMGSASTITITDNQESDSLNITNTGTYQFGPYPLFTPVTFTFADAMDEDCVMIEEVQNTTMCPPTNDNCLDAIALIPGGDMESSTISATNMGATLSPELPLPTCGESLFSDSAKDIWYTVEVPASGNITIETTGNSFQEELSDTVLQAYTGSCGTLVAIACDNDSGTDNYSSISLSDMAPGAILYIRAFGLEGGSGAFSIGAYDASLSNSSFTNTNFTFFPNPVKDVLNVSYYGSITNVTVFNLLGQRVEAKAMNDSNTQIDMSALSKGAYMIRITAGDHVKTIKVIKE